MKDEIIKRIHEALDGFMPNYRNTRYQVSETTEALNAEHTLGEYHALISVLKYLDFNAFIDIVEETREQATELLTITEKAYKGGTT